MSTKMSVRNQPNIMPPKVYATIDYANGVFAK